MRVFASTCVIMGVFLWSTLLQMGCSLARVKRNTRLGALEQCGHVGSAGKAECANIASHATLCCPERCGDDGQPGGLEGSWRSGLNVGRVRVSSCLGPTTQRTASEPAPPRKHPDMRE